ncbi:hypothetical protein NA63_2923 [Flavobacteriaceae bacterium MAR_2010_105]|nr:hypothetical protein NA63_2923 [Flavobacteriaceae bacterium MAR_2010_105]
MRFNLDDKISMAGGTLFGIIPNIPPDDLIVTIIMASIGALVSFISSVLLKSIVKFLKSFKH